ncbi:MAG: dihydropteroate synthase [Bifidobacteriaceae bacterium]|jgi:dihydropteroate synthase|nr:dihydropteroate synthase [Bifidobacteriaceae bacterium]
MSAQTCPIRPTPLPVSLAELNRTAVMGICNVTPDSFSDGGRYLEPDQALAHCRRMLAEGADLIDVGGETTKPGAGRVSQAEELARVLPLIRQLAAEGVPVSVDTTRAAVAQAALEAGASLINDVSGGLADPGMLPLAAQTGAAIVLMHWRGASATMDQLDNYHDPAAEVAAELEARAQAALAAGINRHQIALDPGLGFAKVEDSNWQVLAGLDRIQALGFPVLVGASRKRFLDSANTSPADLTGRDPATAAISALTASQGVWCVRVHAVAASAAAVQVAAKLRDAASGNQGELWNAGSGIGNQGQPPSGAGTHRDSPEPSTRGPEEGMMG